MSVGCRVRAAQRSAVCSVVQECSITKQGAAQLRKVQSSSPRCNADQGTSTVISKSRNAGIPGKMLVRHRHFYGPALSSYVNLKSFFDFLSHISAFQHFFKSLTHFGQIQTICSSKNQSETLPALLQNFVANFIRKGYMYPKSML